jgi:hypothetical protein
MGAVDVRKRERESSGCERRRRRTCVSGEGAENGLQRTVKQSSRLKAVTQNVWLKRLRRTEMVKSEQHSRNGKQAKSE